MTTRRSFFRKLGAAVGGTLALPLAPKIAEAVEFVDVPAKVARAPLPAVGRELFCSYSCGVDALAFTATSTVSAGSVWDDLDDEEDDEE